MATGPLTRISDIIVPEIFTAYIQQLTEEKSRLIQSGALMRSEFMDGLLAGGGLTFNVPSFKDLDNDTDNVMGDQVADIYALSVSAGSPALPSAFTDAIPAKTGTAQEIAVRLSRHKSWSAANLATRLAGADVMGSIMSRVSTYWARRLQAAFIATIGGVCRDNGTNDSGDYANDIASTTYVAGTTDFSAEAFIDAKLTMGDSMDNTSILMTHSIVYARLLKNDLIDFVKDSTGTMRIATFMGHEVIVDDNLPSGSAVVRDDASAGNSGCYESWIFGGGAVLLGMGSPDPATEIERQASAGNGGGQDILHNRHEWAIHPVGHAYTGTAPNGGPGNTTGSNDLGNAGAWNRVYAERKQIAFARLITRES